MICCEGRGVGVEPKTQKNDASLPSLLFLLFSTHVRLGAVDGVVHPAARLLDADAAPLGLKGGYEGRIRENHASAEKRRRKEAANPGAARDGLLKTRRAALSRP